MIAINMEMPKTCWDCPIIDKENGQCQKTKKYTYGNDIPSDCPLVAIVTCKDCIHRDEYGCRHGHPNCKDNFYCRDAERRE